VKIQDYHSWDSLPDEELLEKRICDLGVNIPGSELQAHIQELYANLAAKGLCFEPDLYLADEWFVLERKTSIGVPFYLAHPRLKALEQKMMLEVEGGTPSWCMKLLRHETGHAYFYAYELNRNRKVQELFGPSPEEPPESYRPKPYSKSFVRHLDNWYAQSEPDEDFAETFAIWMTPDLDWREDYKGWPALEKLEFMNALMERIRGKPPRHIGKDRSFSASRSKLKIKTYYARKQKLYAQDYPEFYDRDLRKIFSPDGPELQGEYAKDFMRRNRKMIVDKVSEWSGEKKYIVSNLYKKLLARCKQLKMRVEKGDGETLATVTAYLTSMATNYLYTGKFKPTV
jgi:hypothetical protein